MNEENGADYDSGFFEGKDFARRTMPRIPTRKETEDLAQAFSEAFDYEFEESYGVICRAYVAIFERYKGQDGFVVKIACVQYEIGLKNFDHYAWTGGVCTLVQRVQ